MIGVGGCFVTQLPTPPVSTTFTFKGKFDDANQKQTFQINHPDGSTTPFDFKKIKSLLYTTACTPIQPNQTVINAPRCQVVNTSISFNNVQWSTSFETPALCFGSITTYEYLLPNGWSIGSNVSNGSNWIAGGNSVTITSDLTNGVNGGVFIRPVNNCGPGLFNGQSQVVQIPISRPVPVLNITTPDNFVICNGATKTFSLSGLPSGATVVWSLSNTSVASIVGSNTGTSVTVQGNALLAQLNLNATVTHCSFVYNVTPKIIYIGTPAPTNLNVSGHCNSGCGRAGWVILGCNTVPGATSYSWYVDDVFIGTSTVNFKTMPPPYGCGQTYEFYVTANGPCGSTPSTTISFDYTACAGFSAIVSPNPANNEITVSITGETIQANTSQQSTTIDMIDLNTNQIVKSWKFNSALKQYKLNIQNLRAGLYILKISIGDKSDYKKIVKQN
jgi:Secretion system C-terminal sorting domain